MLKIGAASTLTIFFGGQFWVGMFERTDSTSLRVCRVVFGAEPSCEELLELVAHGYNRLRFSAPVASEAPAAPAVNPKRRQREAARQMGQRGPSTKAQLAIAQERETFAQQRKADARDKRDELEHQRFEQRREKHKQKHRGR